MVLLYLLLVFLLLVVCDVKCGHCIYCSYTQHVCMSDFSPFPLLCARSLFFCILVWEKSLVLCISSLSSVTQCTFEVHRILGHVD